MTHYEESLTAKLTAKAVDFRWQWLTLVNNEESVEFLPLPVAEATISRNARPELAIKWYSIKNGVTI
jgi:hypothetical protein